MKSKNFLFLLGLALIFNLKINAQANQTLSNLTSPTAVNQSLLPTSNNTLNLGSSSLGWNNIYMGNILYLNGTPLIQAPYSYMTSYANLYIGINSGNSNTSPINNTAVGENVLSSATGGGSNVAFGASALNTNTTGTNNTAIGALALGNSTTSSNNTALGEGALYSVSTGTYNVGIGPSAPSSSTGSYNTTLGASTQIQYSNLNNCMALGYYAVVTASNNVRIGNTSITSIGGQVGWTTFSDGRYKKNIKENIPGLQFIDSLRPISYTVDIQGLNEFYKSKNKSLLSDNNASEYIEKEAGNASKIVHTGFIAQEVEQTAEKLNFEFDGIDKPQSSDGLYGLRYGKFIVPLVKAVQELSAINNEKDVRIDSLQNEINELRGMVLSLTKNNTSLTPGASLEQNIPNPFSNSTKISYSLPKKMTSAQIEITDINGKILRSISISGIGKNTLTVDTSRFSAGEYCYSLIIDGRIAGTKKMILIN